MSRVSIRTPDAIVIRTVPDEMRFDLASFTVQAGETVKIWFENPDYTPHNLVVGMPDSVEEIALAAESLGALGFAVGFPAPTVTRSSRPPNC